MTDPATTPASLRLVTTSPSPESTPSSSPSSTSHTQRLMRERPSVPQLYPGAVVSVVLMSTDGPHALWDDATMRWWLPVLGPSAVAVLPALVTSGATPDSTIDCEDLGFMCGLGLSQLHKTLERLLNFHVLRSVEMVNGMLTIELPTHLPHVGHRMRAPWPAWYGNAYDAAFPKES